MQGKLGSMFSPKYFVLPGNNHWLKRILIVFAFILFDYFLTLVFCRLPYEEANPFARAFMESLGIPAGLTLFVIVINIPICVTLSLDSNIVRLPMRIGVIAEIAIDMMFAWFVAGVHFNGGLSWIWNVPDVTRQALGALLYLLLAGLIFKPHRQNHGLK